VLKPRGKLLLAYEPPSPSRRGATLAKLRANLEAGGFTKFDAVSETRGGKLQMALWAAV
jgi:hypothetical protein